MKSSDESFDADSLLKDLVEIIDESPTAACTTPATSVSQVYLNWPTGSEVLVPPPIADWSVAATRHEAQVVGRGRQQETDVATWCGGTGSDVTVALGDYAEGFPAAGGVGNNPATWEAVFETEPAAPLKSLCLLPPERFDVNRLISIPSFAAATPATRNQGDNSAVVMETQGILLCDKLDDSLDVLDLDVVLDAGRPLDIRSTTPSFALMTLNPSGVWPINQAGTSQAIAKPEVTCTQLSDPALPLNVLQPLRCGTFEMETSLGDVGSGRNRLCSRCLSDSEVQLAGTARQGSKRQRKEAVTTRTPGVRGRSTSEAGPSRTANKEDAEVVDDFRLHRRREQNRRAARVCRERKRAMSTSMVKEYQDLLSSNTSLRFEIRQLQQEEQSLQTVLEKHLTTCTTITSSSSSSASPPTSSSITSSLAQRTQPSDDPMTSDHLL